MAKQRFFHGTSMDAWVQIQADGFLSPQQKPNWTPSGCDHIYMWSPKELVKTGDCEKSWSHHYAFNKAKENATAALPKAKDCRIVVLEIELDSRNVSEDDSCPHMAGAVKHYGKIPISKIKEVSISEDLGLVRGCFIAGMMDNNLNNHNFSPMEQKIGELFKKTEIYPEDLDEIMNLEYKGEQ